MTSCYSISDVKDESNTKGGLEEGSPPEAPSTVTPPSLREVERRRQLEGLEDVQKLLGLPQPRHWPDW